MMQMLRTVLKVPMKKIVVLFMTFLILLSFSGCTERVENTPPDGKTPGGNIIEGTVEPTESTPSTAEAEGSTADPTESGPQETEALIGPSGVKLRTSDKLICLVPKAGHLEFRFDNARAVNHRSDVQEECLLLSDCSRHYSYDASQYSAEDFPGAKDVLLFEGKTWNVVYGYPDWTEEDGYFGDDIYLILVDVTATNVGAENYTTADRYSDGRIRGEYDDPYIFRADGVPVLTDISGTKRRGKDHLRYTSPVYFSLMNQCSEHPLAFRLAPGESITYTLGFLVTDCELGGDFSLPHLCLTDSAGSLYGMFYKLDIDWSGTK